MSDEKALLAAIWEHPHEDIPRLVYADWLDENGQPDRAEFIRVQVEAAILRWNDPRWKELAGRAKQLLETHGEEWIESIRWMSPGGQTKVSLDEPTIDGWGGGVQLNWVDPHPSDMGDYAPPYERAIDFHRGFPRRVWLEPHALQRLPKAEAPAGPRPQLTLKWEWQSHDRDWIAELWPTVSQGLRSGRFSDWVFTNFNHEIRWLRPLANDPGVARGVSGLSIEGGHEPTDADIVRLYPLMPTLDSLHLSNGIWSPAVIRELGTAGLCRRLRDLEYHNNTKEYSAADALQAMAEVGTWPRLLGLTLNGLEGVGPGATNLIQPGMLPALRRFSIWARGAVPREPAAAFITALLNHPHLSHVGMIQYVPWSGDRDPALKELEDGSNGRFVYGIKQPSTD